MSIPDDKETSKPALKAQKDIYDNIIWFFVMKLSESWVGCYFVDRQSDCLGMNDEDAEVIHICVYCDNK